MPSLPFRNENLELAVKNYAKPDIKVLWFSPILLCLFNLVQNTLPEILDTTEEALSSLLCFHVVFSLLGFQSFYLS